MTVTRGVIQCGCAAWVAVAIAIHWLTKVGSSGSAWAANGANAKAAMAQPKLPPIMDFRTPAPVRFGRKLCPSFACFFTMTPAL